MGNDKHGGDVDGIGKIGDVGGDMQPEILHQFMAQQSQEQDAAMPWHHGQQNVQDQGWEWQNQQQYTGFDQYDSSFEVQKLEHDGFWYYEHQQFTEAADCFRRALQLNPHSPECQIALNNCLQWSQGLDPFGNLSGYCEPGPQDLPQVEPEQLQV